LVTRGKISKKRGEQEEEKCCEGDRQLKEEILEKEQKKDRVPVGGSKGRERCIERDQSVDYYLAPSTGSGTEKKRGRGGEEVGDCEAEIEEHDSKGAKGVRWGIPRQALKEGEGGLEPHITMPYKEMQEERHRRFVVYRGKGRKM